MPDHSPEPLTHSSQRYAIALPCEPEQFSDFISRLLGKPQIVSRSFYDDFVIDMHGLENLHHLITQRVTQQNAGHIVQFTAEIIYNDNSSVTLNSFTDFAHYKEVRPLRTRKLILCWVFLLTFQGRGFPEKQQIDVVFDGSHDLPLPGSLAITDEPSLRKRLEIARISIRVSHTERTWGSDIETLISGHISRHFKQISFSTRIARKYGGRISLLTSIVFICLVFLGLHTFLSERKRIILDAVKNETNASIKNIDIKIDYLFDFISITRDDPVILFIFMISIILTTFSMFLLAQWAKKPGMSFIIITSEDTKKHSADEEKERKNNTRFFAGVSGQLLIGIVSNVLVYLWTSS
jgi:hypothetical protein